LIIKNIYLRPRPHERKKHAIFFKCAIFQKNSKRSTLVLISEEEMKKV